MTAWIYLTYEQVVEINELHCGAGAGVLNENGIRAQLDRASATYDGKDLYPTVWEKAAVLLHGLSSTQYFADGNKRTAWLVADLFLSVNHAPLRDIPETHSEAFVLAVATGLFSAEQATEWLQDARVRASDRLRWLDTAADLRHREQGTAVADITQLGFRSFVIDDPAKYPPNSSAYGFLLLQRWEFVEADEGREFAITYSAVGAEDGPAPYDIVFNYVGPHPLKAERILSEIGPPTGVRLTQELALLVHRHGDGTIVVWLDGEEAGRLNLAAEPIGIVDDGELHTVADGL